MRPILARPRHYPIPIGLDRQSPLKELLHGRMLSGYALPVAGQAAQADRHFPVMHERAFLHLPIGGVDERLRLVNAAPGGEPEAHTVAVV